MEPNVNNNMIELYKDYSEIAVRGVYQEWDIDFIHEVIKPQSDTIEDVIFVLNDKPNLRLQRNWFIPVSFSYKIAFLNRAPGEKIWKAFYKRIS